MVGAGRVSAVVVAACAVAGAAAGAVGEAPPPDAVRGCGSRGDGNRPQRLPSPPGVRIGPLVIWPSVRTRVESTGETPWRFYVKAPIVLPARARVVLAVPPEAAALVELQAGRPPNTWVRSVRFEACAASVRAFPGAYRGTVGRYTGFLFGFRLARRLCIPLEVWLEGREAPFRRLVPFGRRSCP
jgi:hypothetical protein